MTTVEVIENKISKVKEYARIISGYQKFSLNEIENDITLKGAVERYLYLLTQATIDLAEAIISYKDFRKPTTYSESFEILSEENIISHKLKEKLVKMAGFRNIIAHEYEEIDFDIIYDVLKNKLEDIDEFLNEVKIKFNI